MFVIAGVGTLLVNVVAPTLSSLLVLSGVVFVLCGVHHKKEKKKSKKKMKPPQPPSTAPLSPVSPMPANPLPSAVNPRAPAPQALGKKMVVLTMNEQPVTLVWQKGSAPTLTGLNLRSLSAEWPSEQDNETDAIAKKQVLYGKNRTRARTSRGQTPEGGSPRRNQDVNGTSSNDAVPLRRQAPLEKDFRRIFETSLRSNLENICTDIAEYVDGKIQGSVVIMRHSEREAALHEIRKQRGFRECLIVEDGKEWIFICEFVSITAAQSASNSKLFVSDDQKPSKLYFPKGEHTEFHQKYSRHLAIHHLLPSFVKNEEVVKDVFATLGIMNPTVEKDGVIIIVCNNMQLADAIGRQFNNFAIFGSIIEIEPYRGNRMCRRLI